MGNQVIWAIVMIAGYAALFALGAKRVRWNTHMLASVSMSIALSFVLNMIKLWTMPQGGSITPGSMLPIVLVSCAYGPLPGFLAGTAAGLLEMLQFPVILHPVQVVLDYPMQFAAIALSGLLAKEKRLSRARLPLCVLLGGLGRVLCETVSGAVFFAEYAGGQNAWVYSFLYNITYLGPDVLIASLLAFVPQTAQLEEYLRRPVRKR